MQKLFDGVYHGLDGAEKLPPTYLHVDEYLATIRLIDPEESSGRS